MSRPTSVVSSKGRAEGASNPVRDQTGVHPRAIWFSPSGVYGRITDWTFGISATSARKAHSVADRRVLDALLGPEHDVPDLPSALAAELVLEDVDAPLALDVREVKSEL